MQTTELYNLIFLRVIQITRKTERKEKHIPWPEAHECRMGEGCVFINHDFTVIKC